MYITARIPNTAVNPGVFLLMVAVIPTRLDD
jgi:hypothetical protein